MTGPRLRQVALVARDLAAAATALTQELGLPDPYADPGISEFGLANAVFAIGDCFLEVVSPTEEQTTAGRYLERRGGDGGYMVIFQVDDIAGARERISTAGIRVVWQHDLAHIGGTHLHPKDVPGAIVSVDWAEPPGSWHWAGPGWSGQVPAHGDGGIVGIRVAVPQASEAARRWAAVLGVEPHGDSLILPPGQRVDFCTSPDERGEGISEVTLAVIPEVRRGRSHVDIAGVRFHLRSTTEAER